MSLNKLLPSLLFVLVISACEDDNKQPTFDKNLLFGKWELQDAWRNGKKTETLSGTYYEFSEDGKMKTNLTPTATEEEFPYSFDGYQIVQKGENEVVYKLDSLTESVMAVSMVIQKFPFRLVLNKSIAEPDTTAVE
ncbi:MAG TPA: hypothetical protein ENJ95_20660 [Bacteroidetes bacterium]|nr:hypothetical protein [Bacteroidota bacterium]